jgi:hypothetical protein
MEYEDRSIPEKSTSDTPESFQECFRIKNAIEGRLDYWSSLAKSNHPSVATGGIASVIVRHCTPTQYEDPVIDENPFASGMTPKEVTRIKRQRDQKNIIASIAQDDSFDKSQSFDFDSDIEDENPIEEYFAKIITFTQNPNSPQSSRNAVQYLHRIYTAESRITERLKGMVQPNPQDYKFVLILNRILDDLY